MIFTIFNPINAINYLFIYFHYHPIINLTHYLFIYFYHVIILFLFNFSLIFLTFIFFNIFNYSNLSPSLTFSSPPYLFIFPLPSTLISLFIFSFFFSYFDSSYSHHLTINLSFSSILCIVFLS